MGHSHPPLFTHTHLPRYALEEALGTLPRPMHHARAPCPMSHAPCTCPMPRYALEEALGGSSLYIWALGLLAAGQAAMMVCTYAGQVIMGGMLQLQLAPWKRVAFTRVFALGPALAVAASTISHPALFNNINEYLNVLQVRARVATLPSSTVLPLPQSSSPALLGTPQSSTPAFPRQYVLQSVQLPFAMLPVLHFTASPKLLGRFRSSPSAMIISWSLALIVLGVNRYAPCLSTAHTSPSLVRAQSSRRPEMMRPCQRPGVQPC